MRTTRFLALCLLIGSTAGLRAQEVCGGFIGLGCDDPHEYCRLADGECCCDFQGVCTLPPAACPAASAPVCGCDGVTYRNRCEAARARMSVAHECACDDPPPGPTASVTDLDYVGRMFWDPVGDALGYNVYRSGGTSGEPLFSCMYSDVPESSVVLEGVPPAGAAWAFLVTPITASGEGTLGVGSSCEPRQDAGRCACTLPPETGECDGVCPRWYYNPQNDQCEAFQWGCCGGNANNFETLAECQSACADPCSLPHDAGPCLGVCPRWFHNAASGQCEPFTWGCCLGNANNFETAEACENACMNPCSLPPDAGPCLALCPRWFHNALSGQCEPFTWGCCLGNANNFETEEACAASCP